MHKNLKIIALLLCTFYFFSAKAQVKKYNAIATFMDGGITGDVYVDLSGPNEKQIRIDVKGAITDTSMLLRLLHLAGKKDTSLMVSTEQMSGLIIGKDTFFRYALRADIAGQYLENCFLKKIAGNGDVKLCSFKENNKDLKYYLARSRSQMAYDINDQSFKDPSPQLYYTFEKCEKMRDYVRPSAPKNTRPFYRVTTTDKKVAVWKKLINKYDQCNKTGKE
jgi:hypothetical protein